MSPTQRVLNRWFVPLVVLLVIPATAMAQIEGLYFVRADPDTQEIWSGPIHRPGNPCPWTAPGPNNPGFWLADIQDDEAEDDADLLIANVLQGDLQVSQAEVDLLMNTLAKQHLFCKLGTWVTRSSC